ncbi:hypothetical protein COU05_01940 [bacterium (Candidatus Gribaldobacteria) CG10_big_fil_rev_8_21_14_0_10_37_21]|uniref:Uncharacterized protein n=1 Tax=bacterium (Candidatus Gribaldobacteria) CG10_big_fil_rev_8_21_14_0_10_37_21 TaxID=2014275 RepID=A0A2H0UUH4_9BACT|nr:MAG: hypothetical protein COU05_01940 [bacterium (Candidatus Gribaldobacteria) CG10_big_fil_rev_8_21_14_0_10_37_21]
MTANKTSKQNKPLTLGDIKKELIPAMEGVFATKGDIKEIKKDIKEIRRDSATKEDLQKFQDNALEVFATKEDLQKFQDNALEVFATKEDLQAFATQAELFSFQDKTLTSLDSILQKLDILMVEKEVGYFQKKKERKLWAIMISVMKESNILTAKHLKAIQELEVF